MPGAITNEDLSEFRKVEVTDGKEKIANPCGYLAFNYPQG